MSIYFIALTSFVLFLSTQVGIPALPALAAQLGADTRTMAAILSAALMTLVLLQFFTGMLADRYGRRLVLVWGAFLGGMSSLLCAVVERWQWLLALRILGGVADAIAMPALLGLTAEIAAGQHGAFFGILRSSQGLSFIMAPVIGGQLTRWGLRIPFIVDGLLSLFICIVLGLAIPDQRQTHHPGHSVKQWGQLKSLFTARSAYAFFLFGMANNFAFPILSSFVPTKGQLLGLTPRQLSVLLASEAMAYTFGSYLVGKLSDRWGRRFFVIIAQPLILLACTGLAWSHSWLGLAAFYAVFGLGASMTYLMSSVMMADITPSEQCATVLGAFDAAIDLVLFIAPAFALTLYGLLGRIELLFLIAGIPALLAWLVAWRVRDTRPLACLNRR
ncbi:MAG: MFS transporter [Anaerolineae bacterium]